jgi:putative molybdopterin biosynthesis protein
VASHAQVAPRPPRSSEGQRPLVAACGHDPLLEWALRESRSGIAGFFEGALDGLQRAQAGDCVAAGLHIPEGGEWNVAAVAARFTDEPWVLIEWARRARGLIMRPERSETDLAMAIADGRADVGLGIAAAARQFKLDFAPLIEERFDLLVWRKAYFDPPFQKLVALCLSETFRDKAKALGGYDVSGFGTVRFNG